MKMEILNTNWHLGQDPPEGTVTFRGKNGAKIGAFSYGVNFDQGQIIEVDFGSINEELEWNIIFSENRQKEKKLVATSKEWEYEAYGQILSVNPVIVDFGELELNTGSWTNDERVVGEYVYWKIGRLDLNKL